MKRYRKTLVGVFLSMIGMFTLYVYLRDQIREAELKLSDREESYEKVVGYFLQHVEKPSGRLKPETVLYKYDTTVSSLFDLTEQENGNLNDFRFLGSRCVRD